MLAGAGAGAEDSSLEEWLDACLIVRRVKAAEVLSEVLLRDDRFLDLAVSKVVLGDGDGLVITSFPF